MKKQFEVLKRPIVTEKATQLKANNRQIVVEIATWANKHDIRQAAKALFNVEVEGVRTSVVRGKMKRIGTTAGKNANWKKAILTLADGSDLDVFGVVAQVPVAEGQE